MFLKVKRLQSIQSLILEADLIQIGGQIDNLVDRARKSGSEDGKRNEDPNEILNKLLDSLFAMNESDLDSKLDDPAFDQYFGNPNMKAALDSYFMYLNERILEFRKNLEEALSKEKINEVEIEEISNKIFTFVARIHILEKIYAKLASKGTTDFSGEIYEKIKKMQDDLADAFSLKIKIPAKIAQQAYANFEQAETEEAQKEAATEVFDAIHTAEVITDDMSDELTAGIQAADKEYEAKIDSKLGAGTSADLKSGLFINKNTASIIRRIFQFQYTNWTNEADIIREANSLKVSINGFPDVSDEAKEYLVKMVDGIQKSLIERAKSKEFETQKYKGIHYDFNKKLPLYERTALPVTGKQIADDTKIMKFRKAAQALMGLVFGEDTTGNTAAGQAFAKTGKHLHTLYAKTLNTTAKAVGKAVKGREGEMKADAYSRLFILDTSVVDEPKPKAVTEEGEAPGVTPQVPGSIGSMGPITPPTQNTIGSGDKFVSLGGNTQKKKKKSSAVLGFADFIKEQNNRYQK
jgi:hypothetical protein